MHPWPDALHRADQTLSSGLRGPENHSCAAVQSGPRAQKIG